MSRYEDNSQKNTSPPHDQDPFIQQPDVNDGVEPKIIHQSKMPNFRENAPFTTEVPRQITRDQYYNFFNNEIGRDIADPSNDSEDLYHHASRGAESSTRSKGRRGKKKGGFQKNEVPKTKAELQKMFESLLKDVNEIKW